MPESIFWCADVAAGGVEHRPVAVIAVLVMHHVAVDREHGHVLCGKVPFLVGCADKAQLDDVGVGGVHKA